MLPFVPTSHDQHSEFLSMRVSYQRPEIYVSLGSLRRCHFIQQKSQWCPFLIFEHVFFIAGGLSFCASVTLVLHTCSIVSKYTDFWGKFFQTHHHMSLVRIFFFNNITKSRTLGERETEFFRWCQISFEKVESGQNKFYILSEQFLEHEIYTRKRGECTTK